MFGIIDRSTKEERIFSVYDDRRKENLLPIISNNVSTIVQNDGDIDLRTRVYSDCFSAYSETDFNAIGYRLHRVNHSVWFGQGYFHTNTFEGLWSTIKRINNNFSGLNNNLIKLLNFIRNYLKC